MSSADRRYPPDWCSAETMAYLLDLGTSTFRAYVAGGDLPAGKTFNGVVRWQRERTLAAFENRGPNAPAPINDNHVDPILAGIMAHGAQAKSRRGAAHARP